VLRHAKNGAPVYLFLGRISSAPAYDYSMTWFTIKDGKVASISKGAVISGTLPAGSIQVPDDHGGFPGDSVAWFTKDWHRIPDSVLIEQGTRKDRRGIWFSTKKKGETRTVHHLDEEPGDGWTRDSPGEYDIWDKVLKKWTPDTQAKTRADEERELAVVDRTLATLEQKILRSLVAKQTGTATSEDERYFNEYSTAIMQARTERKRLVDKLNKT
jgi:hypothetical protein